MDGVHLEIIGLVLQGALTILGAKKVRYVIVSIMRTASQLFLDHNIQPASPTAATVGMVESSRDLDMA